MTLQIVSIPQILSYELFFCVARVKKSMYISKQPARINSPTGKTSVPTCAVAASQFPTTIFMPPKKGILTALFFCCFFYEKN